MLDATCNVIAPVPGIAVLVGFSALGAGVGVVAGKSNPVAGLALGLGIVLLSVVLLRIC